MWNHVEFLFLRASSGTNFFDENKGTKTEISPAHVKKKKGKQHHPKDRILF